MTTPQRVRLAVDLGASSGRVVAGLWDGGRLRLEELHRFDNGPTLVAGHLQWNVMNLWTEIQAGMRRAADALSGHEISSLGVDTWGVDFALLGRGDELLGNPYAYRDRRTVGVMAEAFETASREQIFSETGLQFMELNTLYQLIAMRRDNSPLLAMAESFLMIPDLFHWLMTGEKSIEATNATTTQLFNPITTSWSASLLERFDLPAHIFRDVVAPGTALGSLRPEVAEQSGLTGVEVIAPGTHDTASAVMAVPTADPPQQAPGWCYISSGTWSLMGVETPQPIINDRCRELNFTNEGGVGGTTRVLKNIAGLWLIQECRRAWRGAGREYDWEQLMELAAAVPPLMSLFDPDHPELVAPQDMPATIRRLCADAGEHVPDTDGAVIRCALESLALRYRQVLNWLQQLTGGDINTIHIVGGGSRNRLLCQMTADATRCRVVAGPVEATAIGNIMLQAVVSGDVGSIAEAREIIRISFDVQQYTPQHSDLWDDAFARFA